MKFSERLLHDTPILLDGGLGTALLSRGLPRGSAPESWNLERGDVLTSVHRAYVEAGSEAIHTNTFGANPARLAAFGLADKCEAINRAGVRLARAASPRFVIADVGPTGEYLPPVGSGDVNRWRASFGRVRRGPGLRGSEPLPESRGAFARETRARARSALQ